MFWDVTETHPELYKKYLCPTCYTKTKQQNNPSPHIANTSPPKLPHYQLNYEIAQSQQRLSDITTAYTNGQISKETFMETTKKLEAQIALFEEMRAKGNYEGFINYKAALQPSLWWYLVPLLFALLGGVLAYLALKDEDRDMATSLFWWGVLATFAYVLFWLIGIPMLQRSMYYY